MANQFSLYRIAAPTADRSTAQQFVITVDGDQVMEEAEVRLLTQLKFETGEQVAAREGDDLVVIFADGSTLRLKKYYLLLESGQLRVDVEGLEVPNATTDSGNTDSSSGDEIGDIGGLGDDDEGDDDDTDNQNNATVVTPLATAADALGVAAQAEAQAQVALGIANDGEIPGSGLAFLPQNPNLKDDDFTLGIGPGGQIGTLISTRTNAADTPAVGLPVAPPRPSEESTSFSGAPFTRQDAVFNQFNPGGILDERFNEAVNTNDVGNPAGTQVVLNITRILKNQFVDIQDTGGTLIASNVLRGFTIDTNVDLGAPVTGDPAGEFTLEGDYGFLTVGRITGDISYTLKTDANTQRIITQLGKGETVQEIFSIRISDTDSESDTQLILRIGGINDSPTASNQVPLVASVEFKVEEAGFSAVGAVINGKDLTVGDGARSLFDRAALQDPELYPDKIDLPSNPFTTSVGQNRVSVFLPSHGLDVGDTITISNTNLAAPAVGGITGGQLVGSFTIMSVISSNAFTINVPGGSALSTIVAGGGNDYQIQHTNAELSQAGTFQYLVFAGFTSDKVNVNGDFQIGNSSTGVKVLGEFTSINGPAVGGTPVLPPVLAPGSFLALTGGTPVHTTIGTNDVRLDVAGHTLQVGEHVLLSGFVATGGIAATDINGVRQVVGIVGNTITFDAGSNATSSVNVTAPGAQIFEESVILAGKFGNLVLHTDGSFAYTRTAALVGAVDTANSLEQVAVDTFTVMLRDTANHREEVKTISFAMDDDGIGANHLLVNDIVTGQLGTVGAAGVGTIVGQLGIVSTPTAPTPTGTFNTAYTNVPQSGHLGFNITDVATLDNNNPDLGEITALQDGGTTFTIRGKYGTLTLVKTTGTFDYAMDQADKDAEGLLSGQEVTDRFRYTVFDGDSTDPNAHALSDTAILTVTVVGANDTPTAVADTATAVEAGGVNNGTAGSDAIGNVLTNDTDPDLAINGETKTVIAVNGNAAGVAPSLVSGGVVGTLGTLRLTADGSFDYKVDDTNATVQGLAAGESTSESFNYTMADRDGVLNPDASNTSSSSLQVTINGVNDAPDITGAAITGALTENAASPITIGGTLNVVDVDVSNTVSITVDTVAVSGTFAGTNPLTNTDIKNMMVVTGGALAADPSAGTDFQWTFTAGTVGDSAFNFLREGETLVLDYTLKATDSNVPGGAATDTQVVTVTITGTNDAPDITGATITGAATEANTTLSANGTLNVVDTDISDTVSMTVDSVTVDAASTFLTVGLGTVPLTNTDIKNMMAVTGGALAADPTAGTNFNWTFTSGATGDAAFNFLGTGETLILKYTLKATDSSGVVLSNTDTQEVTITITGGNNDAPIITGTEISASLVENAASPLTATGDLNVVDPNQSDKVLITVDSVAVSGSFAGTNPLTNTDIKNMMSVPGGLLNANPSAGTDFAWTFTSGTSGDSAFNFLAAGETLILDYTLKGTDNAGAPASDTQLVTITITGTNDQPTLTVPDATGSMNEGNGTATLTDSGTLSFADLDLTDVVTVSRTSNNDIVWSGGVINPGVAAALVAGFTVDQNSWDYSSNQNLDFLGAGETIIFSFNVVATDDSGAGNAASAATVVTITINGTNDQPTLNVVDAAGSMNEGNGTATLTDSGTLSFADLDINDGVTVSQTSNNDIVWSGGVINPGVAAALVAGFSVDQNSWDYSSNQNLDFLGAGETIIFSFNVVATDDSGAGNAASAATVVTVTINGTNDQPTLNVVDATGSMNEGNGTATLTDSGTLSFADLDINDGVTVSQTSNNDIVWSGGVINPGVAAALVAGFSVDQDSWDYSSNQNLDFLGAGETIIFSFNVVATDDSGAGNAASAATVVTITINGTNDQPTLNIVDAAGSMNEGNGTATLTDSGALSFADLDTNDGVTVSQTSNNDIVWSGGTINPGVAAALVAGFSVDQNSWDYSSNQNLDFLGAGETIIFSFNVVATDDSGAGNAASAATVVTVTINGTNDQPTLNVVDATGSMNEGNGTATLTDSGALSFADLDTNDGVTVSQTSNNDIVWSGGTINPGVAAALVAGFSVDQDSWDYSSNQDLDFLGAGETITFSFNVVATDDSGAGNAASAATVVTVTINGTNDQPTLNIVDAAGSMNEGNGTATLTDSGALSFADLDTNDGVTVSQTSNNDIVWSGGTINPGVAAALVAGFSVDQNSWDYSSNQDLDFLGAGETITFSFNVVATDDSGAGNAASAATVVTVTINGTNDQPTLNIVDAAGSMNEGNGTATLTDSGALSFADLDTNDGVTVSQTSNNDIVWSGGTINPGVAAALVAGFTVDQNSWDYSSNQDLDFLGAGETITFSFNVVATDDSGAGNAASAATVVTITINGSNDQPTLNIVDAAGSMNEGNGTATLTDSATLSFADLDTNDGVTVSQTSNNDIAWSGGALTGPVSAALVAGFSVDQNSWDYSSNQDLDFMSEGETITFSYNVVATDDSGAGNAASVATVVNISLTGVDDAPTLTATGADPNFVEGAGAGNQAPAVTVFSSADAEAIDHGQTFTSLKFTVSGLLDGANERVTVDGTQFSLTNGTNGSTAGNSLNFSVAVAAGIATVTLTSAGVSAAIIESVINGIAYQNTDIDNPTDGNRVFTLTEIQDSGIGADTTALNIVSTVDVDPTAGPVALDLDGNGIAYQSDNTSTHLFDIDGHGTLDRVAWVKSGDGMLAYDANHDGLIDHRSEVVFTDHAPGARTDLDALHLAFDTNNDYKLDVLDKEWSSFGVWHDVNQDGTFAANEFQSLESMGITSLSLVSDHVVSSPENGVVDLGLTTFTYADGQTGMAADVALAYESGEAAVATSGQYGMADGSTAAATGAGDLTAMSSESFASAQLHATDAGSSSSGIAANSSSLPHIDEVLQNTATAELQLPPPSAAPHTDAAPAPALPPPTGAAVAAAPGDTGSDPQVASNSTGDSGPAPANDTPPPPPPPVDDHAGAPAAVV